MVPELALAPKMFEPAGMISAAFSAFKDQLNRFLSKNQRLLAVSQRKEQVFTEAAGCCQAGSRAFTFLVETVADQILSGSLGSQAHTLAPLGCC